MQFNQCVFVKHFTAVAVEVELVLNSLYTDGLVQWFPTPGSGPSKGPQDKSEGRETINERGKNKNQALIQNSIIIYVTFSNLSNFCKILSSIPLSVSTS